MIEPVHLAAAGRQVRGIMDRAARSADRVGRGPQRRSVRRGSPRWASSLLPAGALDRRAANARRPGRWRGARIHCGPRRSGGNRRRGPRRHRPGAVSFACARPPPRGGRRAPSARCGSSPRHWGRRRSPVPCAPVPVWPLDTHGKFGAAPAAIAHQRLQLLRRPDPRPCRAGSTRPCAGGGGEGRLVQHPAAPPRRSSADDDPGRRRRPAPDATMRAATSGWSRPIGIATTGTPWASALIAVPWPACVTTALACRSTCACGAEPDHGHVRRGVDVLRRHRRSRGDGPANGSWPEPVRDPPQHGHMVLVRRAHADKHQRLVAGRRCPVLHPLGVVEARARRTARSAAADRPGNSKASLVSTRTRSTPATCSNTCSGRAGRV